MKEFLLTINNSASGLPLSFALGLILGSFFNVCICRLPLNESLWRPSSHCRKCAKTIPWYWNIPVISYITLRGRCGYCSEPISLQYPIVEISTGLLYLLLFLKFGASLKFVAYATLASLLLIISVIDLYHRIIPDELSLPGIAIGLGAVWLTRDLTWQSSLLGLAAGGGVFFSIAYLYERVTKREGLGGGDVKLLAMLGAWLGVESILIIIVISSALGSIIGIFLMAFRRKGLQTAIPFGPFLAAAGLCYVFFGDHLRAIFFPDFS